MFHRPLLDGPAREEGLGVVTEIAEALSDQAPGSPDFAGGSAGLALFYTYLDAARPGCGFDQFAQQHHDRAVAYVATRPAGASFYAGFTGVAWVSQHLEGRIFGESSSDEDPNAAVDQALLSVLRRSPYRGPLDLIDGLVGFGVYALDRLPRPSARQCLDEIVLQLEALAEPAEGGCTWKTPARFVPDELRGSFPDGWYNLGLAHGVPGMVALLGKLLAAGIAPERVRPLLTGSLGWLRRQRLPAGGRSQYGAYLPAEAGVRPAWCYGDPGVALGLFHAARALGDAALEAEATALAREAVAVSLADSGLEDAGVCHGTSGLAHLANRFFQATGDPAFAAAAQRWLDETLRLRRRGDGIAGYLHRTATGSRPETGLLYGAAGIGLVLLAASCDVAPQWDGPLMIDLPVRSPG